jgi:hypothetical protein
MSKKSMKPSARKSARRSARASALKKTSSARRAGPARVAAAKRRPAKAAPAARGAKKGAPDKHVYFFGGGRAEGDRTMRDLLGGKGAGLAEMTNAGLPVPPGFTITTAACNLWYATGRKLPQAIEDEMLAHVRRLEKMVGQQFGSTTNPLLVSVRSGAKFSMPGMMDTILNLGLNDQAVEGLKATTGNGRFAFDSYRRFIQMFGNVVLEIPKEKFEHEFEAVKKAHGAATDTGRRSSRVTRISSGARRASPFRRIPSSSSGCRATRCSGRGTTRGRSTTAGSTRFPTTSARR